MKLQKNTGFTLIEVLLALAVLATSMVVLSNLQMKSVFRVWQSREEVDRVFLVKQRLYNLFMYPKKLEREKKEELEEPAVKIETRTFAINRKSSLYPLRDKLMGIGATGTWDNQGRQERIAMVSFVLKAREETK